MKQDRKTPCFSHASNDPLLKEDFFSANVMWSEFQEVAPDMINQLKLRIYFFQELLILGINQRELITKMSECALISSGLQQAYRAKGYNMWITRMNQ